MIKTIILITLAVLSLSILFLVNKSKQIGTALIIDKNTIKELNKEEFNNQFSEWKRKNVHKKIRTIIKEGAK